MYEGWSEKGVLCSMHLVEWMNKSSILVEDGQAYQTWMWDIHLSYYQSDPWSMVKEQTSKDTEVGSVNL